MGDVEAVEAELEAEWTPFPSTSEVMKCLHLHPPHVDLVPPPAGAGEDPPPQEDNVAPPPPPAPPPAPVLAEVMDRQTRLLEAMVEGLNRRQGGPPNDF